MISPPQIQTPNTLLKLALEAEKRGLHNYSENLAERATRQLQQVQSKTNQTSAEFASILLALADICADNGRFETAELFARESVSILVDLKGSEHPSAALAMRCLGEICSLNGKLQEAKRLNDLAHTTLMLFREQCNRPID